MIARNEELMLPDCLQSVRPIASEIIVVDTGSTDKTRQIAIDHGALVYDYPWTDDFSDARNQALSKAKYPWILSIDADERLENPDILAATFELAQEQVGGFLLEVCSHSRRKDGTSDVFKIHLLRLFRNNPKIRFEGAIHEQVLESILGNNWKISSSGIKLQHLGYDLSPENMLKKQYRNLGLLDQALFTDSKNAYLLFQRAKTYLAIGNLSLAERDIKSAISLAGSQSSVLPQALNYGGIIAFQSKNLTLAAERAKKSLKIVPQQSFACYVLGEALTASGDFANALIAYNAMISVENTQDPIAQIIGEYNLPPEQMHFRFGRCYVGLQQWDKAKYEFQKGIEINNKEIGCRIGLANVYLRLENFAHSRKILQQIMQENPERSDVSKFLEQVDAAENNSKKKIINEKNINIENNADLPLPNSLNFGGSVSSTPLISLCMIVKNEEKFLPGCLASAEGIVDEIIIIDTGSSDRTKEIARQYKANIVDFKWQNDFAAARNESLRHARGTWILYLDADERLHAEAKNHLRELLQNLPDEVGGLICTIVSPHRQLDDTSEEHRGGYPRIFKHLPNVIFEGRVHEQISPAILASGKQIVLSEVVIEHLGYDQSREILEQKTKRNYNLLLQHVREEPQNAYAWFQLGQTLARMNLSQQAEDALKFAMDLGTLKSTIAASATAALAQIAGNAHKYADALQWAEKSLYYAPEQLYARQLRAFSLHYLGRNTEAKAAFLELLERRKYYDATTHGGFDILVPEPTINQGLAMVDKSLSASRQ